MHNNIICKYILILFFLIFTQTSAYGELTSKQIIENYNNNNKDRTLTYITGAAHSFIASSEMMGFTGRNPELCLPKNMNMNAESFYQIFRNEYYKNEDKNEWGVVTLYFGLINTFPCKKNK